MEAPVEAELQGSARARARERGRREREREGEGLLGAGAARTRVLEEERDEEAAHRVEGHHRPHDRRVPLEEAARADLLGVVVEAERAREDERDHGHLQVALGDGHVVRLEQRLHHGAREARAAAREQHAEQPQQRLLRRVAVGIIGAVALLLLRQLHEDDAGGEQHDGRPARLAHPGAEQQPRAQQRRHDLQLVGDLERHGVDVRECIVDDVVLHGVERGWDGHLEELGRMAEERLQHSRRRGLEALLRRGDAQDARDALEDLGERDGRRVDVPGLLLLRRGGEPQVGQVDADVAREEARADDVLLGDGPAHLSDEGCWQRRPASHSAAWDVGHVSLRRTVWPMMSPEAVSGRYARPA
eukprot:3511750-Prymnesium_polylepis.1